MNNDIENLTKTLHSVQFAISDLKQVILSDNLLLVELAMGSLKCISDEEVKISRLVKILETKKL